MIGSFDIQSHRRSLTEDERRERVYNQQGGVQQTHTAKIYLFMTREAFSISVLGMLGIHMSLELDMALRSKELSLPNQLVTTDVLCRSGKQS